MRAVIQRVLRAKVEVEGRVISEIGKGLLVYLSIGKEDEQKDAEFMAEKISGLRIFSDDAGKMNRSIQDVCGELLLVSNFTLHGDCRKGRRPGFDAAAEPRIARSLYDKAAQLIAGRGIRVAEGIFASYMRVTSVNDGPVTFLLDSSRLF
ncbi:MAG: D-tyrosyl-tRNA(Tyr) deacylase [Sedimentisphaerales bacterium]|nr:D-tyrosyl-tRNA(Tyr) deacylase [Sedimentisphaerales bacterium]